MKERIEIPHPDGGLTRMGALRVLFFTGIGAVFLTVGVIALIAAAVFGIAALGGDPNALHSAARSLSTAAFGLLVGYWLYVRVPRRILRRAMEIDGDELFD